MKDSQLSRIFGENSEVIGSTVAGLSDRSLSVRDSTILASELSMTQDNGDMPLIWDSRLERVTASKGAICDREINGSMVGGVTLDGHMTPRLAEAWTRSLRDSPDAAEGAWLSRLDIIDPAMLSDSRDDIDRIRHFVSVGLTAKNPDMLRYFDTVAARDTDYGLIEPILQDDTLRGGLVTALKTMPGMVVNGRFEQSGMAVAVQDQVQALRARLATFGVTSDNPLRGVEVIDRIVSTEPVTVGIGGNPVPALPAITVAGNPDKEGQVGGAIYRPVFVLYNPEQGVSSMNHLRIASFCPPNEPNFESRDEAISYMQEAAERSLDAGVAREGVFHTSAPLLIDIMPREPDKAMLIVTPTLAAGGYTDPSRLAVRDGFQAVIVDNNRIRDGGYLFSARSLDGALGSTTAAAAIADARAESGRGWTYSEAAALQLATVALRTKDRQEQADREGQASRRTSDPGLG